jgi:predicted P-loop ATPase
MKNYRNFASRQESSVEMQEGKQPKKTKQQLACEYIRENYLEFGSLRYDLIADKLQVRTEQHWRYLTNCDINTIVCDASYHYDANITSKEVMTALHSDLVPRVHPLREYINGLKAYAPNSVDWIEWLSNQVTLKYPTGCSEEDRQRLEARWHVCFKKWFVAMVASWMDDDVVNQAVLVLIGRQGCYKTTWLENLMPTHLRDYGCKLANTVQLGKDDRLRIAEFGLINLDELDAMTPRELNAMKSIITSKDVNERAAYAYVKERKMRLASFCASSNKREFLTDQTGNRRWLPFEVQDIQNPYHTILPYDMLYAQAWALVQEGFNYWFDQEDISVLEQHNEDFRMQESEEQLLPILFDIPAEGKGVFMTTAQISERLVSFGNIKNPMHLSRLGTVLGRAGYSAVTRRIGGVQTRGWVVYQRDSDEVKAMRNIVE